VLYILESIREPDDLATLPVGQIKLPFFDDSLRQVDVLNKKYCTLLGMVHCKTTTMSLSTEKPRIFALSWNEDVLQFVKRAFGDNIEARNISKKDMLKDLDNQEGKVYPGLTIIIVHLFDQTKTIRYLNCIEARNAVVMILNEKIDSTAPAKWIHPSTGTVCIGSLKGVEANLSIALEKHLLYGLMEKLKILQHMANPETQVEALTSEQPDGQQYLHFLFELRHFLTSPESCWDIDPGNRTYCCKLYIISQRK